MASPSNAALLVAFDKRKSLRKIGQRKAFRFDLGDKARCPLRVIARNVVADAFKIVQRGDRETTIIRLLQPSSGISA